MSRIFKVVAAAAAIVLPSAAIAGDATTTRIETRPFYGATVTLEAGVRVFRPLPAHNKVIINPGGVTPLSLGFEEHRSTSHNYNYNYDRGGSSGYDGNPGSSGAPVYYGGYRSGGIHAPARLHGRSGFDPAQKSTTTGPRPSRVVHPAKPAHHPAPAKSH